MEKTIRVLYDYQTFHAQRFGGISRYFCEIAGHACHTTPEIAIGVSMNQYIRHSDIKGHTPIPMRPYKIMSGWFRDINRKASIKAISKGDFDLFHPTYYDPYFLEALQDKPFVLTIHDMTHERFPQYFPNDPTPSYKKLLAAKAKRIIAISECTKRDIMEYLNVPEEKIDVIYHGLDPQPLAEGRPDGLPDGLVSTMKQVLTDDSHRHELTEKGTRRLSLFTWDETARRTEETYMKALADTK